MELYIKGKIAVKGQEVTTFRGEKAILTGWREPQHAASSGRVYITIYEEDGTYNGEFFPGVIGAEFKEDPKKKMKIAMAELLVAASNLWDIWEQSDELKFGHEDYPFEDSFDELADKIHTWVETNWPGFIYNDYIKTRKER